MSDNTEKIDEGSQNRDLSSHLRNGLACPVCMRNTTTYRHPYAKVWCPSCGFVLREEGDRNPYSYKEAMVRIEEKLS